MSQPVQTSTEPNSPAAAGATPGAGPANLDDAEIERFQRLAKAWWDPLGKFRPLHQIGPARLTFIRDELTRHFGRETSGLRPLKDLRVLDVGCGGGLMSEPLARLGARVTGIDPGDKNIAIARDHATPQGLDIDYRVTTAEALVAAGELYDAVACLEVVEHVPDVGAFVKTCASLVRPGGMLVLSTINRTLKSYALAIVAAEYVLGWLPRGTHQWDRFVTPDELGRHIASAGLGETRFKGFVYSPLRDQWSLADDTDVNYLVSAVREPQPVKT
ncbi:bifunctional 2-polyprenyl-6-hydroxyphenol methylase/3-demethylubiquinol 3-O-methyltransferase UbiG [Hyphomicrobium zavarzinii]|jgi:2-polyprenyl-6-hydroxyphenyl methylase/3-demethylubiquinone-9 3-methyltransferase|uniref:bifunctional 2-polyprenyl-6-hydroxyphenol methylase/3-demethylubiquinol 3-O-methyltransferase UbiG n=1 Tax=Hyphomicrobium zavarzinii TaxID=48292 RepID=UPI000371A99F|nr:bifunctional 2-polyprenyl-6-hydroxyphenol methylase/3-demethylubiquinol 3-O-methyltransferase UbiG [Hyphomicrobium zavarzinii]HML42442.1 bifunctional 2-polyprenyl-6-hydroxyphenol methylase/3-demethylubiquinol 3-O-methyltransferase UbiG [Hyphomicrobium zavarzinii]